MEQQPKPQLDAGVVYRLLPLTVSHDDAQRKPAEQQLLAYESVPGFASLLLVLPPPQILISFRLANSQIIFCWPNI